MPGTQFSTVLSGMPNSSAVLRNCLKYFFGVFASFALYPWFFVSTKIGIFTQDVRFFIDMDGGGGAVSSEFIGGEYEEVFKA